MTDTADTTETKVSNAKTAPMTPRAFAEQLERLATMQPASEVVAFYDRYGPAIQPLLRGNDRLRVAAIMEVADTVVEHEAAAHSNGAAAAPSAAVPDRATLVQEGS